MTPSTPGSRPSSNPADTPGRLSYSLTLFLGAALLFLLQPLFGRLVLPLLGGSPSAWVTSVMWFQVVLLAAYGYAHLLAGRVGAPLQRAVHALLLAGALLLCLPLALRAGPPSSANPTGWLTVALLASAGLPAFVLATTSPLLQTRLARETAGAVDPYPLYRASNLGSAAGLLLYPFVLEPWLPLAQQRWLWSGAFVLYTGLAAWLVLRALPPAAGAPGQSREVPVEPLAPARVARWLLMASVPSSLLLGTTTFITTDLASVPLLWVLPLLLYLLSFVVVFAPRPLIPHGLVLRLLPPVLLAVIILLLGSVRSPAWALVVPHLAGLFVACLACHGDLVRNRPQPGRLTAFYLAIAIGGAMGGVFNTLIAPRLFTRIDEYPLALVLAGLAIPFASASTRRERIYDIELPVGLAAATVLVMLGAKRLIPSGAVALVVMSALPVVACLKFSRRPLRFALGLTAFIVATRLAFPPADGNTLHAERGFFGVLRVTREGRSHALYHGTTLHGRQLVAGRGTTEPLSYYARVGPIGQLFAAFGDGFSAPAVAVAGLGNGTLSAYSRAGERWTFYEIDPAVDRIARNPALFTYVRDAAGAVLTEVGDARLGLQSATDGSYGLIVLDAFTSDVAPVHLLTREAVQLYLRKLHPHGVLVFHISSRLLDLSPVVGALAGDAGLVAFQGEHRVSPEQRRRGLRSAVWVAVARSERDLRGLASHPGWRRLEGDGPLWTDNYSNVLGRLRWRL